jgi:4-hydroxy-2-oxovalerate aldolase
MMPAANATPEILEVTLRDGSYLVDFQFTAEDTARVASALESAGFRWIEVGHGLGLGASAAGKGIAAASDEEYLEAAAEAVRQARWGMFFIPGVGRAEDLRLAARYRMGFVRIGTNITELAAARPFIALAKELGMLVSYNAMKSYAVPPAEFGRCAALARQWGADVVCLVDSAGGMYPEDVESYLCAARAACDARLGFHGHDNLALAMANTLRAVDAGAVLLDASLQGIGRSAGNTITEVLVAILKRRGFLPELDLNTVTDLGQTLIQPALRRRGMDPMAIVAGSARFHSSFTPKVRAYAEKYGLDVRDLIVRLCAEDQVDAADSLLQSLSQELAARKMPRIVSVRALSRRQPKPEEGTQALDRVLKEMRSLAVKAGKFSALNVVIGEGPLAAFRVSGNIQDAHAHVIGSVALSSAEQLAAVLEMADGRADVVFLDADCKPHAVQDAARQAGARLKKSLLLSYSDSRVWVEAVAQQVLRLVGEDLAGVPIVIDGDHPLGRLLAWQLAEGRARVTVLGGAAEAPSHAMAAAGDAAGAGARYLVAGSADATARLREARLVVAWPKGGDALGPEHVEQLQAGTYVIDASIGAILPEALDEARRRGVRPLRVNIWPALAGALLAAHESARIYHSALGWETLADVPVVAGGALGRRGDVIVDSIREPTRVIGVADGRGGVLFQYGAEDAQRVGRVAEEINRRLLLPRPSNS